MRRAGVDLPRFVCAGAVAQLGERLNGIQEVRGSIPLGSTVGRVKSPDQAPGSGGGIGRRAGFRILWGQPREGSSPSSSITSERFSVASNPVQTKRPTIYGLPTCWNW